MKIVKYRQGFIHHKIISTVKIIYFINDSTSCIVLRVHWFNIDVLNVYAARVEKCDSKDSFMRN